MSEVNRQNNSSKQVSHQNENVLKGESAIRHALQDASETACNQMPDVTNQIGPSPILQNSLVASDELFQSSGSVSNGILSLSTKNMRSSPNRNGECPQHVPLAQYRQGSRTAPTPQNCTSTEQLGPSPVASSPFDANMIPSPKNATKSPSAENREPSGCIAGVIASGGPGRMETPPETSGCLGQMKNSLVKSDRALRYGLRKKPKTSEAADNVADVSGDGVKQRKKMKKRGERRVADEFSSIRYRLRNLLQRMSYEQNLINAYSSEGWKGLSREKIKPDRELTRAKCDISKYKLKIRGLFQRLDSLNLEGKVPETLFDTEGWMNADDIFCAKCGSKDVPADNDIILCDGCDRGFHQHCLEPPLLKEYIPPGDEAWLCPGCVCKVDCIKLINYSQETNLSAADNWEKVFPEATEERVDEDAEPPSGGSDDDYNPDGENDDENENDQESSESGSDEAENDQESSESGSDEADYTFDEETYGYLHSGPSDEKDWFDTAAPRGKEAINVISVSLNRDVPVDKKEMISGIKKCGRKRVSEEMNIQNTDSLPATLHGCSSISGSDSKNARPSTYKKLDDAVIMRLLASFKENNYPGRARKESLAQELGLTSQQVNRWFNNRRASFRRSSCTETSPSQSTSQDIASHQSDN